MIAVVARTFEEASNGATNAHLDGGWFFVSTARDLLGKRPGAVVWVDGWRELPEAQKIGARLGC
jgi:hypothetical protein